MKLQGNVQAEQLFLLMPLSPNKLRSISPQEFLYECLHNVGRLIRTLKSISSWIVIHNGTVFNKTIGFCQKWIDLIDL